MHLLRERRQMDAHWGIKAFCGGALRGTQMRALHNQEQKHAISYANTKQEAVTLTSGSSMYLELQRPRPPLQTGHMRATPQLKMEDKESAMTVDNPKVANDAVFKYLLVKYLLVLSPLPILVQRTCFCPHLLFHTHKQTSVPKLLTHNVCMCMCVHRVGPSSAGPGQRGWHANVQPAVFHRLHVTTEHATKKPCGNYRMAGQLSVCELLSRFSQLYESDQHRSAWCCLSWVKISCSRVHNNAGMQMKRFYHSTWNCKLLLNGVNTMN